MPLPAGRGWFNSITSTKDITSTLSEKSVVRAVSTVSQSDGAGENKLKVECQKRLSELQLFFDQVQETFEMLSTENEVLVEKVKMLGGESPADSEEDETYAWDVQNSDSVDPEGAMAVARSSVTSTASEISEWLPPTSSVSPDDMISLPVLTPYPVTSERQPFFPEWPTTIPSKGSAARDLMSRRHSMGTGLLVQVEESLHGGTGCILDPVGWFRLSWDFIGFICLIFQLWMTMFSFAFLPDHEPSALTNVENVTTCFFMLDLLLNFNTGVIRTTDDSETIIMKRSVIVREYCSGFFWIDLVSTIPFDRLLEHVNAKALLAVRMARIARWLKLLRLLRLLRAISMIRSHTRGHRLELQDYSSFSQPLLAVVVISVLAHMNACLWQSVQGLQVTRKTMWHLYMSDVSHMFLALTSGARMDPDGNLCWLFDVIVTAERLVIFSCIIFWIVKQAMLFMESAGFSEHLKSEVLAYLKVRKVDTKTQLAVLSQLNEANSNSLKRSYLTWVSSGVPHELHTAVCEAMWLEHLCSLGLISYAAHLEPRIKVALALLVQEETFAKRTVVFKEGDASHSAYMVLHGVLCLNSTLMDVAMPDVTDNMWLGEKSLVNYTLPRTLTATCKETCTLMVVPSQGFHQLLSDFEIKRQFEEYCVRHLWKGICGRCGVVGDHFADNCPLDLCRNARRSIRTVDRVFNCWFGEEEEEEGQEESNGTYQLVPENSEVPSEYQTKADLHEFLRLKSFPYMLPVLERHSVRCLKDLEDLPSETLDNIIAAAPAGKSTHALRAGLAPESAHYFAERLEERAKQVLGVDQTFSNHLAFLSHHKLQAGTEAALLLRELEALIQDHPILGRKQMERPVFLDSEDLENLETLQEHVSRSHNLLLLLTADVLTRPWVLIEIATATRLGAPIIPVMIKKPGNNFEFPGEEFYDKIRDGTLLPRSGFRVLRSCGVTLEELEGAIRKVFYRISLQYSPHESSSMRAAEVDKILKAIKLRTLGQTTRTPRNSQRQGQELAAARKSAIGARRSMRQSINPRKSTFEDTGHMNRQRSIRTSISSRASRDSRMSRDSRASRDSRGSRD